jgi:hypothetical protein
MHMLGRVARQQFGAEQAVVTATIPDMRVTGGDHGLDLCETVTQFQQAA